MDGNGILSVALSYMKTEMNSWNAEWRTTAAVGEEPGLHTDFYQPLGKGADWFTGASLLAQQFNINIFDEGSNDITEQVRIQRLGATVYAGREFGSWGRGWIGVTRGGGDRSISIGDPSTPDQNFDIGEATFTLEADRLDSLYFSRHGHSALALYRYSDKGLGATENFEQAVFSGRIARSFGANTFIAYGDYKSTISGVAPPERLFRVGGLFNLSGFEYNQLSGQNFAQVAVAYRRDFVNLGPLRLSAGMSLELGNVWENRSDMSFDDALFGGSLFLGSNTPIGPVYFGWGNSEKSDGTFYVSLGAVRTDPVLQ